ncbi:MAG: hypothetical protein F4029_07390 [Gammaproteobacteria bacterium]|nr:hypothetical protein [Gammaproteobacteria bacterium]MYF28372.1 hypothetical protein [Gammaproteobacteria bacterium]MYK46035.1 hypothetical protein [Gammaproteobacteria bacterium]
MQIAYPVELTKTRRGIVDVVFPDFADARTACAEGDEQEAASTLLVDVLDHCIRDRRRIPRPSRKPGCQRVEPPLLVAAKVALYEAMRESELSNVAMARELGTVEGTVRRLLDLRHRSHVDQVEAALATLGKRLVATVRRT